MNEIKLRANLPISRDITTRFLAFLLKKCGATRSRITGWWIICPYAYTRILQEFMFFAVTSVTLVGKTIRHFG